MDHTIHSVFNFLGYILESMIFMLSGTYVGERFSRFHEHMIETSDIWKIVLFHPLQMLLRFASILVLLPILNRTGYKISLKEVFILSYGGLRGAVTLSLGMIVAVDEELDKRTRDLCLFLAISTIVFATCINGVSIH